MSTHKLSPTLTNVTFREHVYLEFQKPAKHVSYSQPRGGGGGGVLRFGSDGGVPLKPPKPIPIFKGHFGGKRYPLLRVFTRNDVFVYFSDEMGENI